MSMGIFLLIAGLVVGGMNFVGAAQPVQADTTITNQSTISTTGNYTAKVEPDIAYISVGVQTFAKNPADAQKENAQKMDNVHNSLGSLEVQEKDIKTVNYSIYPRYEWNNIETTNERGQIERKNERVLVGYEVNNMIRITIRDLDKVGSIIDMTVSKGINQANAISFDISDEKRDEVYLEALKKAVENAKSKAEAIASVYDVTLKNPISIVEGGSYIPSPIKYRGMAEAQMERADVATKTPIAAGEMEIRANVNVVYGY